MAWQVISSVSVNERNAKYSRANYFSLALEAYNNVELRASLGGDNIKGTVSATPVNGYLYRARFNGQMSQFDGYQYSNVVTTALTFSELKSNRQFLFLGLTERDVSNVGVLTGTLSIEAMIPNSAPTVPSSISIPSVIEGGKNASISWGASSDVDGNLSGYRLERSVNGGSYVQIYQGTNRSYLDSINKGWKTVAYRVRAYDAIGAVSGYRTSPARTIVNNSIPNIKDTTEDNKVFYESDTISINGSAIDNDNGNIVSVKYKINTGAIKAIATGISDGTTPIAYSKTLKYTSGKLFDGTTEVATGLVDGQTYSITIWAEDDQGGKSTEVVRNFTVVPNRPPKIMLNPIEPQSDKINSEVLTLSGEVTDPENNDVVVTLRINENNSKQIYSGVPSTFTTDIKISDLIEGNNTLTLTAKDTFNFVTTKTVTIKKTRNASKLKQAIARYKVNPPSGSAKQILAWIQREVGDLTVDADVSMVLVGENEVYKPMTKLTAPVDETLEEDEFSHEELEEKDNITLKLKLSKEDPLSTKSVKQISGVLK